MSREDRHPCLAQDVFPFRRTSLLKIVPVLTTCALAASVLAFAGCSDRPNESSAGEGDTARAEEDSPSLAYPARLEIPQSVPGVDKYYEPLTEKEHPFVPPAVYAQCHYEGWQECLFQFGHEGIDVEKQEVIGVGFKLAGTCGQYTMLGLQDGFDGCKQRIVQLRGKYPDEDLRKMALECYVPVLNSCVRPSRLSETERIVHYPPRPEDLRSSILVTRPIRPARAKQER